MAGEYVRARLRQRDQDLSTWVDDMIAQGHEEGDLVRAGLRLLMGQNNPIAVSSQPISVRRTEKPRPAPSLDRPKVPPKLELKKSAEIPGASIDDLLGQF